MKAISATLIHYPDHDHILIHTNIPTPGTLGLLTFETTNNDGKSEVWIREHFNDVDIRVIDRRNERG